MASAILPMHYPTLQTSPVSEAPIKPEGPADFFPAVCLKSHWDPTQILKRTLPTQHLPQVTDFRPWSKVCMEYTTAGPMQEAPKVGSSAFLPSGGQFYPNSRYVGSIDSESQLRRLDRPLGLCDSKQWEPAADGDMFNSRILLPNRKTVDPMRVEELAYPKALLRSGPYACREEQDRINVALASDSLFNNATKQERYKRMGKLTKPAAPTEVLKAAPERLRPDLSFDAGPFEAAPGSYEASARLQRDALVNKAMTPEQQQAQKFKEEEEKRKRA